MKKLGEEGVRELAQIIQSKPVTKNEKRIQNARDQFMSTSRYNYEMPPMVIWNMVELKTSLQGLAGTSQIYGDMDVDNGHAFSYSVFVYFSQQFHI